MKTYKMETLKTAGKVNDSFEIENTQVKSGSNQVNVALEPSGVTKTRKNVCLSFHDITYEVVTRLDEKPVCGKTGTKTILNGVSGVLPHGLNAIMGPTGSGKTSLLDVLAKRKDPKGLKKGAVLVDDQLMEDDFRLMSGYVVQDDVVMGTLSVKENLAFSANLRLSTKQLTNEERAKKVDHVIEQLGLQACANTLVGNEFVRGVSGGERKRVNIGMEMILDPPVLFLDEPTTGLDANTANSIVLLLYKLAMGGRNIIMSIHQPRYSIFALFDRLVLLSKGNVVYLGGAKESVHYFKGIGYQCPEYHNPADFFLDVVGGDVKTAQLIEKVTAKEAETNYEEITEAIADDEKTDNFQLLLSSFETSDLHKREKAKVDEIWGRASGNIEAKKYKKVETYANPFSTQLQILLKRTALNLLRNPMTSVVQIFVMVIFGLLIGLIYFQSDYSLAGLQNRAGCFFFLATSQVMSNLSALEVFIRNRQFYRHESASGYYRASVYFFAQVLADLIPNRIIPNFMFSCIIYFMIGFKQDAGNFFFFVLTLFSTAISASSIAFLVSASVELFAVANVLVSLPYIFMMLFSGFLANIESILPWLAWIKYFSILRYGINALTVNEMTGLVFYDYPDRPGFDGTSCTNTTNGLPVVGCTTGEDYMDSQGITYGVWGMWQNIVALMSMAVGFLALTYVQLRRINKYK